MGMPKSARLRAAAEELDARAARELLASGADPDGDGHWGAPLIGAARSCFRDPKAAREIFAELIAAGADPDARDKAGWSALHWMGAGSVELVGMLIAAGADPEGRSRSGMRPAHCLAAAGNLPAFLALLGAGADAHALDDSGWSPLHHAAAEGSPEAFSALLGLGADPEAADPSGMTPRLLARRRRFQELEEALILQRKPKP